MSIKNLVYLLLLALVSGCSPTLHYSGNPVFPGFAYHRRPLNQTDRNSREVCIDKMEFDSNGHTKPVILTHEGVAASKISMKKNKL